MEKRNNTTSLVVGLTVPVVVIGIGLCLAFFLVLRRRTSKQKHGTPGMEYRESEMKHRESRMGHGTSEAEEKTVPKRCPSLPSYSQLNKTDPRQKRQHDGRVARSPFLKDLDAQQGEQRRRGRAAVVNYHTEGDRRRWEVNASSLKGSSEKETKTFFSESTRLVILEDVGADWIRPLAKLLQLPERVFALHWAHPHDHLLGDVQIPLGENPKNHFILQYRQPLPFEIMKTESSEPESLACNVQRTVVRRIRALKDLQTEKIETAEQLVSYYSGRLADRDIAVLLVDPCPKIEDQFPDNHTIAAPREPLPHMELNRKESEWYNWIQEDENANKPQNQHPLSMYDELVQYFDSVSHDQVVSLLDKAPYYWAAHCCSIVLARNASTVQSSFVETWKLIGKASTGVKKLADFDFDKLERKAWSDDWKGEFFTQLWELREELELMQYRLQMNKRVLNRLATIPIAAVQNQYTFRSTSGDIINNFSYPDNKGDTSPHWKGKGKEEGAEFTNARSFDFMQQELEEWDKLVKMNSYAIQLMNRTTETYVQAIGATATQFANEHTRNSKKLTGFVAVFVPASLCAAVLAIPSFSPDSKSITKFWVFWAVSVPLAIILGILFLTELPHWVKDKWEGRSSKRSEDDIKEALRAGPSGGEIYRTQETSSGRGVLAGPSGREIFP